MKRELILIALLIGSLPACADNAHPATVSDITLPCEPLPEGEPLRSSVTLVKLPHKLDPRTSTRLWCAPTVHVAIEP